jgi:hypothetical protein
LTESEAIALQEHGLFNLADFRGQRPSAEGVAAIKAMFHASLAGEPYDFAQWGTHFRPYGSFSPAASTATTVSVSVPETVTAHDEPVVEKVEAEVVKITETVAAKPQTTDILARLREKTAASRV